MPKSAKISSLINLIGVFALYFLFLAIVNVCRRQIIDS